MNQSREVVEASGDETGIGETMEDVVTMVDAMTSAVEAVEAMVMALEMREWLEVGRPETERTTAVHFFSRVLAVQKQKDVLSWKRSYAPGQLYWPGLLPGLVQLLADCLLPHNSKAIQSGAMLSIKYILLAGSPFNTFGYYHRRQFFAAWNGLVSDRLLRLVRESDCTEIRNQAIWLLGRAPSITAYKNHAWVMDFLALLTDLVRKYAAISEPTEADISSLNTAIKALTQVYDLLSHSLFHNNPPHPYPPHSWEPHMLEILPVLISIFKEPVNRKKARIRAGQFLVLGWRLWTMDGGFLLDDGMIGMLLETLRAGKEPTGVRVKALTILSLYLGHNAHGVDNSGMVHVKKVLEMGAVGVFYLVLKRPNDRFKDRTLWDTAMGYLQFSIGGYDMEAIDREAKVEAILKEEGLLELVLELGLGMDLSEETEHYHNYAARLLWYLADQCSASQMRQLMSKESLFSLLYRYLNWEVMIESGASYCALAPVRCCLEKCSAVNQGILRRLLDSTGITDFIRRISLDFPRHDSKMLARNIRDTYLNNPPPPPPPHNLPSTIYTRNVPS